MNTEETCSLNLNDAQCISMWNTNTLSKLYLLARRKKTSISIDTFQLILYSAADSRTLLLLYTFLASNFTLCSVFVYTLFDSLIWL